MISLLSSCCFSLAYTCLIAVRKEFGFFNLLMKVTCGIFTGSSFHTDNCSHLYLALVNHELRPLVLVKPYLVHRAGTLLRLISYMILSMFSVIVSSPLNASSMSLSDVTMWKMSWFMYSHSCMNEFWNGPRVSSPSLLAMSSIWNL